MWYKQVTITGYYKPYLAYLLANLADFQYLAVFLVLKLIELLG
ncbi:hypothetical protein CRC_00172 [Cylindrospermopsis raciborskii CS-505]|nr:hypothetical protein CRC_00172 [Cylindrospermopsis raciborskii CS-505]